MIKRGGSVDKRIYKFSGKFTSAETDRSELIDYYIVREREMTPVWVNRVQRMKLTITINVYGNHNFIYGDIIELHDGQKCSVVSITLNEKPRNVAVRHLLKPVIESITLGLE